MSWHLGYGLGMYPQEVSVDELASLGDESFWKFAASQYDYHEFDSFDIDDGFWCKASQ